MADSKLVTKYISAYTGNYTRNRAAQGGKIREITIHHCAGKISIEQLGSLWQRRGRNGSSHYGVSGENIGQYVAEKDVAWTNSNWAANCRAVTIEVSNSGGAPNWPVSEASLETLTRLVADIAKRNGLGTLVKGKNLTWHSMYSATACPGPYLLGKLQAVCDGANRINAGCQTGSQSAMGALGAAVTPYTVRVTQRGLSIRTGPGTNFGARGTVAPGVYTIVAESSGAGAALWGRLKSGAGWIALDGCKRV